jgi:hypothetical protein
MDLKSTYVLDTQVKGQGQLKGLKTGLQGVDKQTNRTATAMARLKTSAGGAMGALRGLLPLIGTAAMGKFVNDTLKSGDRLEKFSQSTGVAVPLLDKLRKSSELAGTDFNTLVKTFPRLAMNIKEASLGTGKAKTAFDELGISVTNQDGSLRASEQVLLDVADKFKNMEDGTRKAALAYDVFGGKTSEQLIPLLNSGRTAIEGMGTAMTEQGVKKMAAFNDSMTKVKFLFQDLFVELTTTLLPAFRTVVSVISSAVRAFSALPGPVKGIAAAAVALVAPLIAIAPVAAALVISFKALVAIKLGAIFAAAIPAIGGLVAACGPLLVGGAIVVGVIALGKLIGTLAGLVWASRDKIAQAFSTLGEILTAPFRTMINFVQRNLGVVLGPINRIMSAARRAAAALSALFRRRRAAAAAKSSSSSAKKNAEGGFVSGAQLSWVGERGGEYIVPTGKAGAFARNYMAGFRGSSAIPRNAEGGYVPGNASVNITTGPVQQMSGTNYVTTTEMSKAVQSGVRQTLDLLRSDMNLRQSMGIA